MLRRFVEADQYLDFFLGINYQESPCILLIFRRELRLLDFQVEDPAVEGFDLAA
jgi:hypothetical protein